jgi:hypothetical protein
MPGDLLLPAFRDRPVRLEPADRTHSLRALPALVLVVLCALAALTVASSASAATPCGKKVLADWFDNGRIDRIYPLHCYEEAINAIPPDLRDYADAADVITRALQSALHGDLAPGGKDPSPSSQSADRTNGSSAAGGDSTDSTGNAQAAPNVNTSGPSSVPIPLLVLGGLSLALLAAGGLGYLSRRRQAARADDDDVDPLS